MPQDMLFDEWAAGVFAIRRPQEFGAEPGTTVSRDFSDKGKLLATEMAKIAPGDFASQMELLNDSAYVPWVVRWLGERSSHYSKETPYEHLFEQLVFLDRRTNPQ